MAKKRPKDFNVALAAVPEVYVIPSIELFRENDPLVSTATKGWEAVYLKTMRNRGQQFRDKWSLLA